jgi:hypothetical protein
MNQEMQKRIDTVLTRIKEPQSLLSLLDISFVKRVSYSDAEKKLLVYTHNAECGQRCMCCGMVTAFVRVGLERRVLEGLQSEFSDLQVEIA